MNDDAALPTTMHASLRLPRLCMCQYVCVYCALAACVRSAGDHLENTGAGSRAKERASSPSKSV